MPEGNIEQHVLHSATYDEDIIGYLKERDPVYEDVVAIIAILNDASIPRCFQRRLNPEVSQVRSGSRV